MMAGVIIIPQSFIMHIMEKLKILVHPALNSLGYFYGSITKLLGFKPHSHEGKVLGLAAYGNSKKAYKYISKMISYDKYNKKFRNYEKGLC